MNKRKKEDLQERNRRFFACIFQKDYKNNEAFLSSYECNRVGSLCISHGILSPVLRTSVIDDKLGNRWNLKRYFGDAFK